MEPKFPLHDDAEEFFGRDDRNSMRMTSKAAVEVCKQAASYGLWIASVEGGHWHDPGFESRLDSIWVSTKRPRNKRELTASNVKAATFIEEQIVSTPLGGVPPPDVYILSSRAVPGRRPV